MLDELSLTLSWSQPKLTQSRALLQFSRSRSKLRSNPWSSRWVLVKLWLFLRWSCCSLSRFVYSRFLTNHRFSVSELRTNSRFKVLRELLLWKSTVFPDWLRNLWLISSGWHSPSFSLFLTYTARGKNVPSATSVNNLKCKKIFRSKLGLVENPICSAVDSCRRIIQTWDTRFFENLLLWKSTLFADWLINLRILILSGWHSSLFSFFNTELVTRMCHRRWR